MLSNQTYYCFNHQGKGDLFVKALEDRGFKASELSEAEVVLMDIDTPGRVNRLSKRILERKAKAFVYPHAARPFIGWDGLFHSSQYTSAAFVFAQGHTEVIRAYGYKKKLHTVGWAYSEIKPFMPVSDPQRVLFAPIHPNKNGWLSELDRSLNAQTFSILIDLMRNKGLSLTVRHIQGLPQNGIWREEGVRYIEGATDTNQQKELEDAHLVVAHQTYAYIAVALGKPVLMMGEWHPPRNGGSEDTFRTVKTWENYKELLMYPLDILATKDPYGLILRACESGDEIADWKHRMIGEKPFDGNRFVDTINLYLRA